MISDKGRFLSLISNKKIRLVNYLQTKRLAGFRRRIVIMYRTRQQFPSFMGVYIPPCSNVQSSVDVCVCNITTVCTMEVLPVADTNMSAYVASLRRVGGIYGDKRNTVKFTFVFKERVKLMEIPHVRLFSKGLGVYLGVHTPSDILQVLYGYSLMLGFCLCNKTLADSMVYNGRKASLPSSQPSQQLVAVARAFGLDRRSSSIVFISDFVKFSRMFQFSFRGCHYIGKSHIYSNIILAILYIIVGNFDCLIEIELAIGKDKVGFSTCILHELWTVASISYLFSAAYKGNGTYRLLRVARKNTAVVGYCPELTEVSLLLFVKFVSVSYLADSTHDKLRGKMVCFAYRVIYLLMQTKLLKDMTFPRYLRDSVASLVEDTHRVFQPFDLSVRWEQLYLQSQFHTAKIRRNSDMVKYLKKIIMLSFNKEGKVAQFLPETEYFGGFLEPNNMKKKINDLEARIKELEGSKEERRTA